APTYTAQALLRIPLGLSRDAPELADVQKQQVALLQSSPVLERALRQPHVAKLNLVRREGTGAAWLARKLQTEFQSGSEKLSIRLSGSDAKELKVLVNAVAQAY